MDLTRKSMGAMPVPIFVMAVVFVAVPGKGVVTKHKVNASIPDPSYVQITNVRTNVGVGFSSKACS